MDRGAGKGAGVAGGCLHSCHTRGVNSLPPAGWYDDPEVPAQLRYWDGAMWTEHRAPGHQPFRTNRLDEVGTWFQSIFELAWARRTAMAILALLLVGSSWALVAAAGNALEGVVYDDGEWSGVDGGSITVLVVVAIVNIVLAVVVSLAVCHQIVWARLGEPQGLGSSLLASLKALPRLIGWSIVLVLASLGAILVAGLLTVAAGVLGLLAFLGLIVAAVWAWVKLSFLWVAAVEPVAGLNAVKASARVSDDGRFWAVLGRLLLLMLLSGIVSFGASIPLSALGGPSGQIDDAIVLDANDELERVDLGELAEQLGYGGGLVGVIVAIPQTLAQMLVMVGLASLFVQVHGHPRRT